MVGKLKREFYDRDTLTVARELIGKYLVRRAEEGLLVCRITETEAYIGRMDKASHAYAYRLTERTKTMFGPPGRAYIYFVYGMYHCLNFVTEREGEPSAVLIRGGAARGDPDLLSLRRYGPGAAEQTKYRRAHLMDGPGKLCLALGLTRAENGLDLAGDTLFVCESLADIGRRPRPEDETPPRVGTGRRIGIDYAEAAVEFPWRFFELD